MRVQLLFVATCLVTALNWAHPSFEEGGMVTAQFHIKFIRVGIELDPWLYVRSTLLIPDTNATQPDSEFFEVIM
jgi:hypothetical protein